MEKVNTKEKLALFADYWNPRIIGHLNGQHVKAVKLKGNLYGTIMITRMNYFLL